MSFSQEVREELLELKMWDNNSNLDQNEQLERLLIREAFIKKGFISNPNNDYHLEILFKSKNSYINKDGGVKRLLLSFAETKVFILSVNNFA